MNAWNEPRDGVEKFVKDNKLTHIILLDGRDVGKQYGVRGIPTTFWIDPSGTVKASELGFNQERLDANTRQLLESSTGKPGT